MAQVTLTSARTEETDPAKAAERLCHTIGSFAGTKLVTLFAGRERDHVALNRELRVRLPKHVRLVGASTWGEVDREGMHQGSVVVGALSGDFEIGLGLGKDLASDAAGAGAAAIARACEDLGVRQSDLDPRKHIGMVIDDGHKYKKEELLLGVLDKSPALTLVGGGAVDPASVMTEGGEGIVHVDGDVAGNAVLVALFKTSAPFAALRSHAYHPTGQMLRITKVDETCKRALEIDGQPAAKRYSDLIGCPVDGLMFGKPGGFAARPTALRVGREHFLRSPFQPLPDGSILFTNLLDEGVELELMQLGDIAALTRSFFTGELPRRVENPSAAILFHCGGRVFASQMDGTFAALSKSFDAAPPSAGFNVHFEIYSGFQINTTLTVLAFGRNDA
jgi:hypothetical protein